MRASEDGRPPERFFQILLQDDLELPVVVRVLPFHLFKVFGEHLLKPEPVLAGDREDVDLAICRPLKRAHNWRMLEIPQLKLGATVLTPSSTATRAANVVPSLLPNVSSQESD